ncbi:MAG: COG4223 family protein [Caulobacterales bacterium]|jgi:hypothetical protein
MDDADRNLEQDAARPPRHGVGIGVVLASSAIAALIGAGVGAVAPRLAQVDEALDRVAPDQAATHLTDVKNDLAALQTQAARTQDIAALGDKLAGLEAAIATPLAAPAGGAAPAPATVAARMIGLQSEMKILEGRLAGVASQDDIAAVRKDVAALQASFGKVAEDAARAIKAAAATYAVSAATDAARASGPFNEAYGTLAALLPDDAHVKALAPYALTGAPTPGELTAEFRAMETEIIRAARISEAGEGAIGRMHAWLAQFIVIRKVDSTAPPSDAVERAAAKVARNDLAGAVSELRQLGGSAAQIAAPWMARAQARLAIDAALAGIRTDLAKGS